MFGALSSILVTESASLFLFTIPINALSSLLHDSTSIALISWGCPSLKVMAFLTLSMSIESAKLSPEGLTIGGGIRQMSFSSCKL